MEFSLQNENEQSKIAEERSLLTYPEELVPP